MAKEPKEKQPEETPEETTQEETAPETKAEETFTLTKEQMETLEAAAKQLSEQQDKFLRLAAEYDNYRKRTAKEKEGIYADAKIETLTAMLPVYDNLERALSQFGDDDSPHRKGVEMIFTQFKESLAKLGVSPIEAIGQPFDPEKHNAVMHIDDERFGESEVSQVFQAGFALGDKVIRHAIVQVAN